MGPLPVVKDFDVFEDGLPCFLPGMEIVMMDQFANAELHERQTRTIAVDFLWRDGDNDHAEGKWTVVGTKNRDLIPSKYTSPTRVAHIASTEDNMYP